MRGAVPLGSAKHAGVNAAGVRVVSGIIVVSRVSQKSASGAAPMQVDSVLNGEERPMSDFSEAELRQLAGESMESVYQERPEAQYGDLWRSVPGIGVAALAEPRSWAWWNVGVFLSGCGGVYPQLEQ